MSVIQMHTGNVGVSEGIEVGRANFIAGRVVQLVGPVEVIVVAEINSRRRQRGAFDAFRAGHIMGRGLGLENTRQRRQ